MEDVQRIKSLANALDLQSTIMKYEFECYSKYLEEVKASNLKEAESLKKMKQELEPLQTKRSSFDCAKKLLLKSQAEVEQLKQDQDSLIYNEEKKLQSIVTEGEEMQTHYSNKLAAMNKAFQSSPQVAYGLRLKNRIAQKEFDIRKYKKQTNDSKISMKRLEEFKWQKQKMGIVEFARLMVEEYKKDELMREMQIDIERLTRETEIEKTRIRNTPFLRPLKVFITPEAPARVSTPQLTPLMDLMEDMSLPCTTQTQDCTLEEIVEPPPAKVARRSAPPRSQMSIYQKILSVFSSSAAEHRSVTDDGGSKKTSIDSKQIKILDQRVIRKSDAETAIDTEIVWNPVVVGTETGLLRMCKDDNTVAEEGLTPAPAATALTPPTQFQDTAPTTALTATETETQAEVLEESLVTPSHGEVNLRVNDTCETLDLSNMDFGPSPHFSEYSQAKEEVAKKSNLSIDVVYAKKEEKPVTSKFFAKEVSVEVEGGGEMPRAQEPLSVSEHPSLDVTSGEDAQEAMDTGEGCTETDGNDVSLKETAASDLDDSMYDFSSLLVTPSVLLSPRSDESVCEPSDRPIPPTSIFGGVKRAFQLPGTTGDDGAATEAPAAPDVPAPFNFQFQQAKKRGFFSLFN